MVEVVHSVAKTEQRTKIAVKMEEKESIVAQTEQQTLIAVQMEAKESIVAQMVKMSKDVHHQQELHLSQQPQHAQ